MLRHYTFHLRVRQLQLIFTCLRRVRDAFLRRAKRIAHAITSGRYALDVIVNGQCDNVLSLLMIVIRAFVLVRHGHTILAHVGVRDSFQDQFFVAMLRVQAVECGNAFTGMRQSAFVEDVRYRLLTAIRVLTKMRIVPATTYQRVGLTITYAMFMGQDRRRNEARRRLIACVISIYVDYRIRCRQARSNVVVRVDRAYREVSVQRRIMARLHVVGSKIMTQVSYQDSVPGLAMQVLTIYARRQTRDTRLVPANVRLSPFLMVDVFASDLIRFRLADRVAILCARSTSIRNPVESATSDGIRTNESLHFRVFPANDSIAAPNNDEVTLRPYGTKAYRRRSTLIQFRTTLSIVSDFYVRRYMYVRRLNEKTRYYQATGILTMLRVHAITCIQFTNVRPPDIGAREVMIILRLLPRRLTYVNVMYIVRETRVTEASPIFSTIFSDLLVRPAFFIGFLRIFNHDVRLKPCKGRRASIRNISKISRSFQIKRAFKVRLVTSPKVLLPIRPISCSVISEGLAFTRFLRHKRGLLAHVMLLATLPMARHPFQRGLKFAYRYAMTTGRVIRVVAVGRVMICFVLRFAPPKRFILFFVDRQARCSRATMEGANVELPLCLRQGTLTHFRVSDGLVDIEVPDHAPAFKGRRLVVGVCFRMTYVMGSRTRRTTFYQFCFSLVGCIKPSRQRLHERVGRLARVYNAIRVFGVGEVLAACGNFRIFLTQGVYANRDAFLTLFVVGFRSVARL